MAAVTSAVIAVGGAATKGFLANDAAKSAARDAGRLEIEQDRLEQESVARLEQNFYDAIRATTDIYDKQLQLSNVQGSQILEAAQEGDQRGVSATAGKLKQVQDATSGVIADKFADQKMEIDMKRAEASETDAAKIAALFDDRAAAAGLEAKAKRNEAEQLEAAATGSFIDAGVSALSGAVTAFGGAAGKAAQELVDSGQAADLTQAQGMLDAGGFSNSDLRKIGRGKYDVVNTGKMFSPEDFTKFGKIGVDGPLAEGEFSDLDFDEISNMSGEEYDTFFGTLTKNQQGMLSGLQDNNQIFINNNKKTGGIGQDLISALSGIKDTAANIANIRNKNSTVNNSLATDANIQAAQQDPEGFLQSLGIDFKQLFGNQ